MAQADGGRYPGLKGDDLIVSSARPSGPRRADDILGGRFSERLFFSPTSDFDSIAGRARTLY